MVPRRGLAVQWRLMETREKPRVRRALAADAPALVDLVMTLAAERGEGVEGPAEAPPDRKVLRRAVAQFVESGAGGVDAERFALVALAADGAPAGVVSVQRLRSGLQDRPYFFVDDLVVAAAQRRRGVASALLAAVEAEARAAGCDRIELNVRAVNGPALTVIARAGYRKAADVHLTRMLDPGADPTRGG
jgi:GNAT superfamily N-acetyltransferase